MLNKFKQKLKNRKPMEPKKKALVKGLLFGFLAGGLATLTAVGIVGCSMTQGDSKQPQASRKAMREVSPRSAWDGSSASVYVLGVGSLNYGSNSYNTLSVRVGASSSYMDGRIASLSSQPSGEYWSSASSFASANGYGISADYIGGATATMAKISFNTSNTNYLNGYLRLTIDYRNYSSYSTKYSKTMKTADVPTSGEWIMAEFIGSPDSTSSSYDAGHTTAIVDNIFIPLGEVFTGAWLPEEETSSEETSSEVSSDSVDVSSIGYTFGEQNPFSAWAVNPLSEDPATNYDGGAPWLLYTGKPSGSGATTVQTALSTDYVVGDFYVVGNPSQVFDTIRVITLNLTTDNVFVLSGGTDAVQVSADQYARGAFLVSEVQYRNSVTSNSIKVYNFGVTSAKLGSNDVSALTSGAWSNVGYRSIVWQGGETTLTINGYEAPASWWLENNALSSQAAVSTMILGDSNTGVFGLLASAFGSFGAIFGIALIPGLTIGTLLFVPLVVMIIFAIIKLLQK